MKGIDLLIQRVAQTECPELYGLIGVNRKEDPDTTYGICKNGDGEHLSVCIECFKQAIELDYESEEE